MNGYKRLLLLLIILFTINYDTLNGIDRRAFEYSFKAYSKHILKSGKTIINLEYHKNIFIAGATSLPIAFIIDKKLQTQIQKNPIYPDYISKIGDLYGNPLGYVIVGSYIIYDNIFTKNQLNTMVSQFVFLSESVLLTATITSILKEITNRQRPNKESFMSFPSGHTSGSFALAAVVNKLYGKKAGTAAYIMAAFVGTTRINDNKHYLSDVIVGAMLGTLIGRSFAKNYNDNLIKIFFEPTTKSVSLFYEF
ncbi:MAG: phosphatase PAP2 family protein [Candidatus Marinimicrobia bacterium]|nr:phosphatase PAP2 family protein [Candidatus Neomarinimicrobiota bacterium]